MALILSARGGIDGPIHCTDENTGEKILTVEAISIRGNQVRLSFVANDNISIQRDIVYQRENEGGNHD